MVFVSGSIIIIDLVAAVATGSFELTLRTTIGSSLELGVKVSFDATETK